MITFILITIIILLIGIITATIILIKNLLSKINTYEMWVLEIQGDIKNTLNKMREIDKIGTFATSLNDEGIFESDDQVGQVFKEMMNIIEKLNQRIQ